MLGSKNIEENEKMERSTAFQSGLARVRAVVQKSNQLFLVIFPTGRCSPPCFAAAEQEIRDEEKRWTGNKILFE